MNKLHQCNLIKFRGITGEALKGCRYPPRLEVPHVFCSVPSCWECHVLKTTCELNLCARICAYSSDITCLLVFIGDIWSRYGLGDSCET